MELLWKQNLLVPPAKTRVHAYCVFADSTVDKGNIYLYTYDGGIIVGDGWSLVSVEPLMANRMSRDLTWSIGIQECERKTEVED